MHLQLEAFGMGVTIGDPMDHHVWMMSPKHAEAVAAYPGY